jgi:hypothetical protein
MHVIYIFFNMDTNFTPHCAIVKASAHSFVQNDVRN